MHDSWILCLINYTFVQLIITLDGTFVILLDEFFHGFHVADVSVENSKDSIWYSHFFMSFLKKVWPSILSLSDLSKSIRWNNFTMLSKVYSNRLKVSKGKAVWIFRAFFSVLITKCHMQISNLSEAITFQVEYEIVWNFVTLWLFFQKLGFLIFTRVNHVLWWEIFYKMFIPAYEINITI